MYEKLWPDNKFTFRIPYNNNIESTHSHFAQSKNVNLIKCGSSILDTMEALLEGIDDEEWVYWCIDDRFPIEIDVNENNSIFDELYNQGKYDAFDFLRNYGPRRKLKQRNDLISIEVNSREFLEHRTNIKPLALGFWMNHYVKGKVLKRLFSREFQKNENKPAPTTHRILKLKHPPTSADHYWQRLNAITNLKGLWRTEKHYIKFLEPIINGKETKDFYKFYEQFCGNK